MHFDFRYSLVVLEPVVEQVKLVAAAELMPVEVAFVVGHWCEAGLRAVALVE